MRDARNLELCCPECEQTVSFSLFDLEQSTDPTVVCRGCKRSYLFKDEELQRQLKLFVALCRQLRESEEILADTCVAVTVGEQHVEVPYKLLLTRLNSKLHLTIGGKQATITFRMDTLEEAALAKHGS